MKKIIRSFLFAALVFTATGCLDILEEITFNKDGSGTYVTAYDITELVDTYDMLDTTGKGRKDLERTLDSTFEALKKKTARINGVSAVSIDKSKKNVTKLRLNFTNITVLNKVLNQDKKLASEMNLYSQSKGRLSRKASGVSSWLGGNSEEDDDEMMSSVLSEMKYRIVYHLPKRVKKMTNEDATLSNDKKTVTLEVSHKEVKENTKTLANEIKF
jgi:hypothetical protein